MKTMGQIVIPVFYRIDPTHVQELTGSYGFAIAKHKDELKDSLDEVENWCRVLKEIAGMSGLVSQDVKHDSILIEEIIEHVIKNLESLYPLDSCKDDLVGMDSRVSKVESLLCLESVDVRVVGIWGMGGIGKTTIANEVFNKIRHQFSNQCFIERVREKLESYTPDRLQSEILSELLETKNSNTAAPVLLSHFNRKRLSRKKVILILDDVSDFVQIERLTGQVNYGPWSRIIMTSREKQLLKNCGAEIYKVKELYGTEGIWLFCLHAFRKSTPEKGYEILSRSAVEYAQGLPLALKILGSNLYGKSEEEWEDELQQLQNLSDDRIQNILKISYDGLSLKDKENFLDIVFLLKSDLYRNMVESMLDLPGSKIGISRLIDKSLIYISKNKLYMHDLIQQMGKDIICSENQLGKRRRLSHPEDICHAVKRIKGVETIRGISLNMSKIKDVQFSSKAFEKMENLRYLIFHDEPGKRGNKIHLSNLPKFLFDELRFFHWRECPLKSLPSNSNAKKLVKLNLFGSKLKKLWTGVQFSPNKPKLFIPGSEVEHRMKYKNKSGSSMSFQFTQFERLLDVRGLYICAVLDPNLFNFPPFSVLEFQVGCEILIDGHTHKVIRRGYKLLHPLDLQSKHVFLWSDMFRLPGDPPLGQIHFVFFISSWRRESEVRYDDGIIECGVHPVFYDELSGSFDSDD